MIVYSRGLESDYQIVDGRLRDVFLDERLRECVSSLYADEFGAKVITRKAIGSVFFVLKSLAHEDEPDEVVGQHIDNSHDKFTAYAITASHVIVDSAGNAPIYIRINKRDGTSYDHPTDPDVWTKDVSNDLAIYEMPENIPLKKDEVNFRAVGFNTLVTDAYISRTPIAAGQEVFFLGLFVGHPGKGRAQPVIRFGNISLMRHDKIDGFVSYTDELAGKVTELDAYLVEARSWGGQSGSPVLFYHPPLKPDIAPLWVRFQLPTVLGFTHGQYERESQLVGNRPLVSAGIAVVIPAGKIRDLIMSKPLEEKREKDLAESKAKAVKGESVSLKRATVAKTDLSEDGFMVALKKASAKLSEPETVKPQTNRQK